MFEKGLYHGQGHLKMRKSIDDVYIGEFIRGKPGGEMIVNFSNGARYEGSMSIGKFHGFGKLVYSQGRGHYEGEWARGKSHGRGEGNAVRA
jgi:hypothetical protein